MRYITWLIFIDMMVIARFRLLHVLTVVVTYLKWAASTSVNGTKIYYLLVNNSYSFCIQFIATCFVFNYYRQK